MLTQTVQHPERLPSDEDKPSSQRYDKFITRPQQLKLLLFIVTYKPIIRVRLKASLNRHYAWFKASVCATKADWNVYYSSHGIHMRFVLYFGQ